MMFPFTFFVRGTITSWDRSSAIEDSLVSEIKNTIDINVGFIKKNAKLPIHCTRTCFQGYIIYH